MKTADDLSMEAGDQSTRKEDALKGIEATPEEPSEKGKTRKEVQELSPADRAKSSKAVFVDSLPKWFVAVAALTYGTGFLIMSLFLDRFGIKEVGDVFKARCVQVGFMFLLFPTIVASPLFVLSYLKKAGRFKVPFPYAALLILLNFFAVSYCIIAFTSPGYFRSRLFPLISILVVTIGGGLVNNVFKNCSFAGEESAERWRQRIDLAAARLGIGTRFFGSSGFRASQEEVRGFLLRAPNLALIAGFDTWALWGVPIFDLKVLWRMSFYFFYWSLIAALFWLARRGIPLAFEERDRSKGWFVTICMGIALYYLALSAFAYGVYPFIPVAKGGGDFSTTQNVTLWWEESIHDSIPSAVKAVAERHHSRVLKIVEESPNVLFVADPNVPHKTPGAWRFWGSSLPRIVAVRRDLVANVEYFGSNEYRSDPKETSSTNQIVAAPILPAAISGSPLPTTPPSVSVP